MTSIHDNGISNDPPIKEVVFSAPPFDAGCRFCIGANTGRHERDRQHKPWWEQLHSGNGFLAARRPVNVRIRIKLVSVAAGEILSSTDDSGKFVFSRVGAGSYSIVIDGEKDFEPLTQSVEIDRLRNPSAQTCTIDHNARVTQLREQSQSCD